MHHTGDHLEGNNEMVQLHCRGLVGPCCAFQKVADARRFWVLGRKAHLQGLGSPLALLSAGQGGEVSSASLKRGHLFVFRNTRGHSAGSNC